MSRAKNKNTYEKMMMIYENTISMRREQMDIKKNCDETMSAVQTMMERMDDLYNLVRVDYINVIDSIDAVHVETNNYNEEMFVLNCKSELKKLLGMIVRKEKAESNRLEWEMLCRYRDLFIKPDNGNMENLEQELKIERSAKEELEDRLTAEQNAGKELEGRLTAEQNARKELEDSLSEEQKANEDLKQSLSEEQKANEDLKQSLSKEQKAKEKVEQSLSEEQKAIYNMLTIEKAMLELNYDVNVSENPNGEDGYCVECSAGDECITFDKVSVVDDGRVIITIDHKEATKGTCAASWDEIRKKLAENELFIEDITKNGKSIHGANREVQGHKNESTVKQNLSR